MTKDNTTKLFSIVPAACSYATYAAKTGITIDKVTVQAFNNRTRRSMKRANGTG